MASPPPEGTSKPKRHSRNASWSKPLLTRRSTKGPLDAENPLGAEVSPITTVPTIDTADRRTPSPPISQDFPTPETASLTASSKNLSFLQRPEIYHPLTQLDLPAAFRTPSYQPPPATPLPILLSSSHFRSAAISAAYQLCTSSSLTSQEIFSLFYIRLACLTLINSTPFAAEESKALEDLNSPFYLDEATGVQTVPWELRVLAVRLQGIGYGDSKRGVLGYYDLARDAREQIGKTAGNGCELWQHRLDDLGVRVGNALVEMGDLTAAARHFEGLQGKQSNKDVACQMRLALLYLRLGDVAAARRCLETKENGGAIKHANAALLPLLSMAEGRYQDAISEWTDLQNQWNDEIVAQNLAVCMLYAGRLGETIPLLTSLISTGQSFHTLTFNLVTIYELCSERSRTKKFDLVEQVAAMGDGRSGERSNADFKL